jgi:zinc protease
MRLRNGLILSLFLILAGGSAEAGAVEGTVTFPDPQSPFVAFNIWFKVGSQNDPQGKEGLAVLTAELLETGSTQQDSYERILEKLYPLAAEYESSVDKEMTVFRGTVHRDNLDAYYLLLRNALLSPGFKQDDFNRVKTQRVNYVQQRRRFSSDEELAKEVLFREIFRGTPYEHPEEGYAKSVPAITLDDVRKFYGEHYRRGNVVVGLAGNYPDGFVARVRRDFDALPEGRTPVPPAPKPRPVERNRIVIVEKDTKATAISMGFPFSLLRSDPDFIEMMLANSWLGEHRNSSSHLYQVIRETRGMNYGDYTYIEAYPMGHMRTMPPTNVSRRKQIFQIWIRPISMQKPGDMHDRALFATRAALREFQKLVETGLSEEQFQVTRGFLRNYTVNYGATLGQRLGYRIDDQFYGIKGDGHLAMIRPELERLTLERVNSAVRKHLRNPGMCMVFITSDAKALKGKLLSGVPTPIEYPAPKPAAVLEEDKVIQSFPIRVSEEDIRIIDINSVLEE